jgi:thiamine biosynthesis lipoprotein
MGTTCEVVLVGGTAALHERARLRVEELESAWSRFRADSEITRLNQRAGETTRLSADSFLLVARGVAAWHLTGGRYDPTVLAALEAAGYDRSFEQINATDAPVSQVMPAPGCADILLDGNLNTVFMPPGVGFDPGGIGKGMAADLVTEQLLDEGAAGASVSLGGDGRTAGEPPPGGWRVGIGNPYSADEVIVVVDLAGHGVATSSRLIRRWTAGGISRHHLLDPRTGKPIENGLDAVTVIAPDAWAAEILTKAAFVSGPNEAGDMIARTGAAGLLVSGPDQVRAVGPFTRFVVSSDESHQRRARNKHQSITKRGSSHG